MNTKILITIMSAVLALVLSSCKTPMNIPSDYAFAKWNSSIYHRNKKGNLILDKKIKVSADVPKSINMNIKVPTQKYNFR